MGRLRSGIQGGEGRPMRFIGNLLGRVFLISWTRSPRKDRGLADRRWRVARPVTATMESTGNSTMPCDVGAVRVARDADREGIRQGRRRAAAQGQAGIPAPDAYGARGGAGDGWVEPGPRAVADGLEGQA